MNSPTGGGDLCTRCGHGRNERILSSGGGGGGGGDPSSPSERRTSITEKYFELRMIT